jgi:nucleoid DNA-binding protein
MKPSTKERVQIPASKSPAFKPGKTLKDSVNQ